MGQDRQSSFEANEPGLKLAGSNNATDAKKKEPRPDEEAVHSSYSQQTHLDAQAHNDKEPHPDEEVVDDSDSQQSDLNNKPHPGAEARCDEEPSHDIKAQCKNESSREENNNIHTFKEPRPDEEAGLDSHKAHYDRGWAWVVLATTFLMEFFVGGLITSSGVIYAALIDEFNKSRAETGD